MSGKLCMVKILENTALAGTAEAYLLRLAVPPALAHAKPGQFVHVLCGSPEERPLRRAFAIAAVTEKPATLTICYHVVGDGTAWLAARAVGEEIDIIAPLGQGFSAYPFSRILLVGEGRGMFALLAAAQKYGKRAIVLLSYPTADMVHLADAFSATGAEVKCYIGTARRRMAREAKSYMANGVQAVQLAAPMARMKDLATTALARRLPCEVMLTPKLACGVGACRGCTRLFSIDGEVVPRKICSDGPVFDARVMLWDSRI